VRGKGRSCFFIILLFFLRLLMIKSTALIEISFGGVGKPMVIGLSVFFLTLRG